MVNMKRKIKILCFLTLFIACSSLVFADSSKYVSSERAHAAIGHYARARAMLVQALAEFELARKLARPDMLIDAEEWRISIVSRTEELNRILDPQPRTTRSGVRFKANPLNVKRASRQVRMPLDGARDNNTDGEVEFMRLKNAEKQLQQKIKQEKLNKILEQERSIQKKIEEQIEEKSSNTLRNKPLVTEESSAEIAPPTKVVTEEKSMSEDSMSPDSASTTEEDKDVSDAIEKAIKERLKNLSKTN